jgi:1-acyl-sn-glycerol-3-phosphate acyltransferase
MAGVFRPVIRALKGLAMMFMFGVFAAGILVELISLPFIRIMDRRSGPNWSRMQWLHRVLMGFWLYLMRIFRLLDARRPQGRPHPGPCVVVCNHPGLFDVISVIRYTPKLSVLANYRLTRRLPLGPIFRSCGYVLSPDLDRISPLESLESAMETIEAGYKFLLFPEGTRSPVGGLHSFKAGAFKIANRLNVPVQPVLIKNVPPFMPKNGKWYYPPLECSRLELEFWEPLDPPPAGKEREFARELQGRFAAALGLSS